ncbi:hypothetical protein CANARDRAFT_30015 [[Candida] arabinofermentans NRRL YB-2248]|uniref:Uncharacterized protein n=1 Tax=[Candida] arabinofermentans NRRL YB-2248 TaxID=983967 RepID=A0A1E4SV50_9ASCO|nr:hypothetical protein CANARDRAFT_30015 [[Candida] arabinofermentans NRRL YB-2248]
MTSYLRPGLNRTFNSPTYKLLIGIYGIELSRNLLSSELNHYLPSDLQSQTANCIQNLYMTLNEQGLMLSNIVSLTVFVSNYQDSDFVIDKLSQIGIANVVTNCTVMNFKNQRVKVALDIMAVFDRIVSKL